MTIFTTQALVSLRLPSACFVALAGALSVFALLFAQVRDLHAVGHLACWIAAPTLYLAVVLFFFQLLDADSQHSDEVETDHLPPVGSSKMMVAFMNIVMTYAGHVVYFELIAAMEKPKDFGKALLSSQGVIMVSYLCVALLVYAVVGEDVASPFQLSFTPTLAVGIADLSMVVHVLISLLLNHHVVSKVLANALTHIFLQDRSGTTSNIVEGRPGAHRMIWLLATAVVMACAWFIANIVPFFSDVMALLSAIAAVNLTYGFPAAAALLQHRRELQQHPLKKVPSTESGDTGHDSSKASIFVYPAIEAPCCWLIVIFSVGMMVYGSFTAVLDTVEHWGSSSRLPFGC